MNTAKSTITGFYFHAPAANDYEYTVSSNLQPAENRLGEELDISWEAKLIYVLGWLSIFQILPVIFWFIGSPGFGYVFGWYMNANFLLVIGFLNILHRCFSAWAEKLNELE